jgi:hypothetical protein
MLAAMETVSEAITRLTLDGYTESFRAEPGGLRALGRGVLLDPAELRVDELARYEGPSDPADEALVLALRGPGGLRGIWVVPFGPGVGRLDARAVQRLRRSPRGAEGA